MNHEYDRMQAGEINRVRFKDYYYAKTPGRESLLIDPRPRFLFESVIGSDTKAKEQWQVLLPHFKDAIKLRISGHLLRTGSIAGEFASFLGMSRSRVDLIKFKGMMHDLGKTQKIIVKGVEVYPFAHIINSENPLSMGEHELMETHADVGAELLDCAGMPEDIVYTVRHHHDNNIIDPDTAIVSLADIYDATLGRNCHRPYRKGEIMSRRRVFCEEAERKFGHLPLYSQFRHWEALSTSVYRQR